MLWLWLHTCGNGESSQVMLHNWKMFATYNCVKIVQYFDFDLNNQPTFEFKFIKDAKSNPLCLDLNWVKSTFIVKNQFKLLNKSFFICIE